jgi:hypothetical protein
VGEGDVYDCILKGDRVYYLMVLGVARAFLEVHGFLWCSRWMGWDGRLLASWS